jgi:hypothetical protein
MQARRPPSSSSRARGRNTAATARAREQHTVGHDQHHDAVGDEQGEQRAEACHGRDRGSERRCGAPRPHLNGFLTTSVVLTSLRRRRTPFDPAGGYL